MTVIVATINSAVLFHLHCSGIPWAKIKCNWSESESASIVSVAVSFQRSLPLLPKNVNVINIASTHSERRMIVNMTFRCSETLCLLCVHSSDISENISSEQTIFSSALASILLTQTWLTDSAVRTVHLWTCEYSLHFRWVILALRNSCVQQEWNEMKR